MTTMTKGQATAADVAALLRARNPLLWVVTREEARVERLLIEAAGAAGYVPMTWDVAQGAMPIAENPRAIADTKDPGEIIEYIRAGTESTSTNPDVRPRAAQRT